MRELTMVSLAAGALLAACSAADDRDARAGTAPDRGAASGPLRYADQDRDGKVTRTEALADPVLARNFTRYDSNGSGALERAEFARLEAEAEARREERQRATAPQPYGKPK